MKACISKMLFVACLCGSFGMPLAASENAAQLRVPENAASWNELSLQEKSMLWPMLTNEQRLRLWRTMSQHERRSMRRCMSHEEQKVLKDRFVTEFCCGPEGADGRRAVRRMTPEERQMLRIQIRETHDRMRQGKHHRDDAPEAASVRDVEIWRHGGHRWRGTADASGLAPADRALHEAASPESLLVQPAGKP